MKIGIPEPEQSSWSGNKGAPMADYDIGFYCEKCRQTHPLGVEIRIKGGPSAKQSVEAFFADRQVPPDLADFVGSQVLCPKTGKMFTRKDLHQIFLVPLT
jgi:hypothetical protein